MLRSIAVPLAVVLAGCTTTNAPAIPHSDATRASTVPEASFRDILAGAYGGGGGGAVTIVTRDAGTLYLDAIDARGSDRPSLQPDTVLPIGSITKHFTATLVMLLVEDGVLDLDRPVGDYLPDYSGPARVATLRQLLSHRAGMVNFPADFFSFPANLDRVWTTEQLLDLSDEQPLLHAPGTARAYSNPGYFLVGAVIEEVTGQRWDELIETRIAAPLGLSSLAYRTERLGDLGIGGFDGNRRAVPDQRLAWAQAAGGLTTDIADLETFFRSLHEGDLLGEQSMAALFGGDARHEAIFPAETIRGRRVHAHGGGLPGFASAGFYDTQDGTYAAVMTNAPAEAPRRLVARRLLAAGMGEPYPTFTPVPWPPERLAAITGLYRSGDGEQRVIRMLGGTLVWEDEEGVAVPLGTAGDDVLYARGERLDHGMARISGTDVTLAFYEDGERPARSYRRIGDVPETVGVALPMALLDRYVGRYAGPVDLVIAVTREGDTLTLGIEGRNSAPLIALDETTFRVDGDPQRFRFVAEDGSAASALLIDSATDTFEATRMVESRD